MMLRRGQGDRHLGRGGAHAPQRLQQIVTPQRQGEEVEHAELFGAQHEAHRGRLGDRDETGAAGRAAQRLHPPGQVFVAVVAQHREHHVPAFRRKLAHRAGQIRGRLQLERCVPGPLAHALRDAAAFGGDHENPQQRRVLLARRGGGRRGMR